MSKPVIRSRHRGDRWSHRWAAWLVSMVLAMVAVPAPAQMPDYGRLFGSQTAEERAAPQQSLPGLGPGPADYARLADGAENPMLGSVQKSVRLFRARVVGMLERAPRAFDEITTTLAAASPTGHGVYFLGIAVFAGLLLVVGQAVTAFFVQFVARPTFIRMQASAGSGYSGRLPVLLYRVLITAVAIGLTVLIAAAVGLFFYQEHEATMLTVIAVFGTWGAVMLVDTIWRMIVAPFLPGYRLPQIGDADARGLYRWLTMCSGFGIVAAVFCYWTKALGLPREVFVLLTVLLMSLTLALFIIAVRAKRQVVSAAITGGNPEAATWLARGGAVLWAPAAVTYLAITWADLCFRLIMGIEAGPVRLLVPFVTVIAGLFVYAGLIYVIERIFDRQRRIERLNAATTESTANGAPVPAETLTEGGPGGDDEGGVAERIAIGSRPVPAARTMRTMEELFRRLAALVAFGVSLYALALLWGGADYFARHPLIATSLDLLQVAFLGYAAFHATRIWLDRRIEDEGGVDLTPGDEGGGAGASRLATLLPLVRNFILTLILLTIALIVAIKLGANVAPLFAGAGIVGLAIGFGSQTLVRDILSGAFFLLDDAFRKGEYIDVGQVKGTVEKISLRSFQLRHHLGMLHTIPFGEIQHLTNFSRDWVMMKLPLRLTYDTDVERVRKLVKKIGEQLLQDPEVGAKFMQPLKSQGVIQMDDSAMIVRVKFMTRPGDQWVIRKRVFAAIREQFEREGITFAHREVTVRIPGAAGERPHSDAERRAIGAAARSVVDVSEAELRQKTGTGGPLDDR